MKLPTEVTSVKPPRKDAGQKVCPKKKNIRIEYKREQRRLFLRRTHSLPKNFQPNFSANWKAFDRPSRPDKCSSWLELKFGRTAIRWGLLKCDLLLEFGSSVTRRVVRTMRYRLIEVHRICRGQWFLSTRIAQMLETWFVLFLQD